MKRHDQWQHAGKRGVVGEMGSNQVLRTEERGEEARAEGNDHAFDDGGSKRVPRANGMHKGREGQHVSKRLQGRTEGLEGLRAKLRLSKVGKVKIVGSEFESDERPELAGRGEHSRSSG